VQRTQQPAGDRGNRIGVPRPRTAASKANRRWSTRNTPAAGSPCGTGVVAIANHTCCSACTTHPLLMKSAGPRPLGGIEQCRPSGPRCGIKVLQPDSRVEHAGQDCMESTPSAHHSMHASPLSGSKWVSAQIRAGGRDLGDRDRHRRVIGLRAGLPHRASADVVISASPAAVPSRAPQARSSCAAVNSVARALLQPVGCRPEPDTPIAAHRYQLPVSHPGRLASAPALCRRDSRASPVQ